MKLHTSLVLMAAVAVALAASGCSKSSPTAPQVPTPSPTIFTPISAVITRIQVTKWPAKATSGASWDNSVIVSARMPDIYVDIPNPAGGGNEYVSNTVTDVPAGTVLSFEQAVAGGFPVTIPYGADYRIYVMDSDVGGDDDRLGWITINLPGAYRHKNERTLDHTFTDSGKRISVRVLGEWRY